MGSDGDEYELTAVMRHARAENLSIPLQDPRLLPLAELEPEVLERLAAEIVQRRDNMGVQFYGRRGQKQHGLDIVEAHRSHGRSLYQVKRYQRLKPSQLRKTVAEYAVKPRPVGFQGEPRRFDPRRFVVVTSAELDTDTANVDELAKLQEEYAGDLEIEVWGAEALSRTLRAMPQVVYAVFGEAWAKAFCGFEPGPQNPAAPDPRGFIEDPAAVLGLDAFAADAQEAETSDPTRAAKLFDLLAQGLEDGNFPAHAASARWRQARALQAAGDDARAFAVLFDMTLRQVREGWSGNVRPALSALEELCARLDARHRSRYEIVASLAGWPWHGSQVSVTVPALRKLVAVNDGEAGVLACLVLEQALVDGLYDWSPPHPLWGEADPATVQRLQELRELASSTQSADAIVRARLRCAVADASLTSDASADRVDAAYHELLDGAAAGRVGRCHGLVAARAARAYAMCGAARRVENLLRRAILASSEACLYGDVRGAIRSAGYLAVEAGVLKSFGPSGALSHLPNSDRLLAGGFDPALSAYSLAQTGDLSGGVDDARRFLWEARLSGHIPRRCCSVWRASSVLVDDRAAGTDRAAQAGGHGAGDGQARDLRPGTGRC